MATAVPAALAERRRRLASLSWCMRPPMSLDANLKLLDWTGRQVRAAGSGSPQRGVIPSDLQPILDRPRIVGDAWLDSVGHFGRWFHRAVDSAENVQSAATRAGKRWFRGIGFCRQAFC